MRYVTTEELVGRVAGLMGIDPDSAQLDQALALQIGSRLDERVRQAWEAEMWPFAVEIVERQFAADYAAGTTYAADDVVLGTDGEYYVSQQAANAGNDPLTDDGTWWLTLAAHMTANTDFSWRYEIAFDQAWDTEFHEVSRVWNADPLAPASRAEQMGYSVTATGIVVDELHGSVPATVWLLTRAWAPRAVAGPVWSAGSYASGAVVYSGGSTYVASEEVASDKVPGTASEWVLQQVPRDLAPFVVHAAYADSMRSDGQTQMAMAEGQVAASILADIKDRVLVGQQQTQRAIWSE